jgi:hypothetical protein
METLFEILKYTIPALIVFFTAYFSLRIQIKNDQRKRDFELILKNKNIVTPVRLQAYERMALFLERISPDNLVMRFNKENMTVKQMQNEMLKTIRSEFDHNLSQQIYISPQSWQVIKNARENVVKLINNAAQKLKPSDPAIKLSKSILERLMEQDQGPTKAALNYLKSEVRQYY